MQVPQHSLKVTMNDVLPEHCSNQEARDYVVYEPSPSCWVRHCMEHAVDEKILPKLDLTLPRSFDRRQHHITIVIKIFPLPLNFATLNCEHLLQSYTIDDAITRTHRQ